MVSFPHTRCGGRRGRPVSRGSRHSPSFRSTIELASMPISVIASGMPQQVGSPANHGEREPAQTRCLTGRTPLHPRCLRQGRLPREHVAMRPPPCGLNHATRLAMGGSRRHATRRHAARRHAALCVSVLCRVVGIVVARCPLQLASAPQRPTRRVSSPSRLLPRHRACVSTPRLCRPGRLCRVGCANSRRRDPRMESRSR